MTCPACAERATNPQSGLYHANCPGCNARQSEIARPLHMQHLKGIPGSADRRAHIETVTRREGQDAGDKLKADFAEWWGKVRGRN